MADNNSNDEAAREQRALEIEVAAALAEVEKHEKATKVAEGLQNTRAARDAIRKRSKG